MSVYPTILTHSSLAFRQSPNGGNFHHPKTQTVVTFLVLLTTGLQYMVQRLNYARDLERIERIKQDAKTTAWGNRLVSPEGQKKASVI